MNVLRFLLLEDSLLDTELIQTHLTDGEINYQLFRVETRSDFIKALEQSWDLILSDYSLPAFDGISALEIAQNLRPDIPFIFVSATLGEELAIEALKSGATDYVLKQRLWRLIPSVKRALREGRERQNRTVAESALKDALQRLSFHVDNSPLAVIEWDREFRVSRWCGGAEKIFGWQTDEVLGKRPHDWQFIFEEDAEVVQNRVSQLNGGSEQRNVSCNRNYTKQGEVLHCEWYNSALCDESGNLVSVLSLVLDISDRVQAQEASQRSEERFRLLFEKAPVGITIARQGLTLFANEAYLKMFGYKKLSEVQGKPLLNDIAPQCREEIADKVKRRERGETVTDAYETMGQRQDGTIFPYQVKVARIELPSGLASVAYVTDITERQRAENQLRQQAEQLKQANRLKDEFLAVLSHELRSPLNSILGWAKLLRSRKFSAETTARALETMERNAQLQTQLIEDLLDISRIIQGKINVSFSTINLMTPIEAAVETMRLAASAKSIRINAQLNPNVGKVLGDPNRLQQVIWNLLSNAIKFSPQGSVVEVELSSVELDLGGSTYAEIRVSDRGKGINREFLPHVFDYFRQADSSITRTHGGLGLGLAIVRHLVELHGGIVTAESSGEGQGATFRVRLPMVAATRVVPNQESLDRGVQTPTPNLAGVRVLVVDDETDTREYVSFVLEDGGAEVTAVSSASEALEALKQLKPDVLVSDIGMPEEDGYMLLRQVRSLAPEFGGLTPAIALTAYAREEDEAQALAAGFQIHVSKPIEPQELIKRVVTLLGTGE